MSFHHVNHEKYPLIFQEEKKLGLIRSVARHIPDFRRQKSVTHSMNQMLFQRVFAIDCGEEDLNDHAELRLEISLQTVAGSVQALASLSTLCRLENRSYRKTILSIN